MTKEEKINDINTIIKQRELLKNKKYLECPVCNKMCAEIDMHRPSLLRCYYCMKNYEINKIDPAANIG